MKIAVIGAGTTAIMALFALKSKFKNAEIVQYYDTPAIGVGEATIPEITAYMDKIGLTSSKLIKESNASFKTGVKFENWANNNNDIWFPFGANGFTGSGYRNIRNQKISGKIWKYLESLEYGNPIEYPIALHFDVSKLHSLDFGIQKIHRHISGDIKAALVANFDVICDCSGFNSVFKPNEAPNSVINELSNNQAHIARIPHTTDKFTGENTFRCYSIFKAAEQGWIWHIPTQEALGIGYVHNSKDSITKEFSEYLEARFGAKIEKFGVVNFKNFASENPYRTIANCKVLNLGLSSCFIEPIQATGLYLTALGIELGMQVIAGEKSESNANFELLKEFEGVSGFVAANLKYCRKSNEYWDKFKSIEIPEITSSVFTKEETTNLYKSLKAGYTMLDDIKDLDTSDAVDFLELHNQIIGKRH